MSSVAFQLLVILAAFIVTTQALPYLNGEQPRRRRHDVERTKRNLATSSHPNSSSSNPGNRTRRSFFSSDEHDFGIDMSREGIPLDTIRQPYSRSDSRILNGSLSNQMSFMVSLQFEQNKEWFQFCGASVISDKTLLTAAHCFPIKDASRVFRAVLGTNMIDPGPTDGFEVQFIYTDVNKNDYTGETTPENYKHLFDIAVIVLPKTLPLGKTIDTICLANAKFKYVKTYYVLGWGLWNCLNPSQQMRIGGGKVDKNKTCEKKWRDGGGAVKIHISQMCAHFKNFEQQVVGTDLADSGGPLMAPIYAEPGVLTQTVQFGLLSFIYKPRPPCPDINVPQVFTNVWEYKKFIKKWSPDSKWCDEESNDRK